MNECGSCQLANRCHAMDTKNKRISNRAVMLGFGIPVLLLIGTLIVVLGLIDDEGAAAMAAFGALASYYLILWLFRSHVGELVSCEIE